MKQRIHYPLLLPIRLLPRTYHQWRFVVSQLLRYGELAPPSFYLFADQNLIYISVPKVACTSIKITIGQAYGIEVHDEMAIHEHPVLRYGLGKPPKTESTIFAFVRNPYDRLVSCYRDKVIDTKQKYTFPHFMQRPGYYYPYQIPSTATFEQFVKTIITIPDFLADNHFKSQYAILSYRGKLLPNFIGHLETIGQDWARLAATYHLNPHLVHANITAPEENRESYHTYYTPELAELVYQRYQQDFEELGYSQARKVLLEMLDHSKKY